jgi:hypothetical protein
MRLDCGGTTFCMNYEFPMWPNQWHNLYICTFSWKFRSTKHKIQYSFHFHQLLTAVYHNVYFACTMYCIFGDWYFLWKGHLIYVTLDFIDTVVIFSGYLFQ